MTAARESGDPPMRPETRLVHVSRDSERDAGTVNPPVYRASTIVYPSLQAYATRRSDGTRPTPRLQGTPTTLRSPRPSPISPAATAA